MRDQLYYCLWCGRGPFLDNGLREHKCDKIEPGKKRTLSTAELSLNRQQGKTQHWEHEANYPRH